jgi:two-component system, LytTR family, sensor kinase
VLLSAKKPGSLVLGSGRQVSHNTLFWSLQTVGWILFGLMTLGYELSWENPRDAVIDDAVVVVTGIALTSAFRLLYRWYRRRTVSPVVVIASGIALAIAGSFVWFLLQVLVSRTLNGGLFPQWHPYLYWSSFNADMFLYTLFILLTWSLLYFGINGWIRLELERRRADRADALAQSAQLRALQSQLEPHFLFNTLNGISSLVVEGRSDAAAAMIARLSDFLRLTLKVAGTPQITLADELVFVRQYLDIEQLRFGDRLDFGIEVTPEAMEAMVPAMLLQPLVENSVRHAILPRALGGKVVVSGRTDAGRAAAGSLILKVDDDGPGMQKSALPASGVGLSNTATRLAVLYGGAAEFAIGRGTLGGVGVTIRLPLRTAAMGQAIGSALGCEE